MFDCIYTLVDGDLSIISKFEDELDYVSKLESVINNNTSDYERYRIYDLIDPTNSHLSEKFMNCIDPNNFTPMSN